jgi:AcrR family transcriptional regulator
VTTFKRARSDEQRAERRRAILDTAAAMLADRRVADLSLNELSRRVCLAKSNVLRYFESREAILLELLESGTGEWLAELTEKLHGTIDPARPVTERGDAVAAVVAGSLARRPVLCDLIGAQAAVLERNVSRDIVTSYKHAAVRYAGMYAELVRSCLPELRPPDALRVAVATSMMAGAIWTHSQPSAAVLAAYEADPRLAEMWLDFEDALRQTLEVIISGLIARSPA